MDFHSLSRRQLQALCKKNKIPANLTNLAMADALNSLHLVEGIDEFVQSSQSETTNPSIELPAISEVTSPYVSSSGIRSSRRRQAGKKAETDPETFNSMNRSRFVSRKNLVHDIPESQGGSLIKDNIDNGKMDALMTPAPRGDTGRCRRVKEDSTVKRAYSTRRSVRLAQKHTKMLNEEDNDMASTISKQLPDEIGCFNVDANLNEVSGIGVFDEMSGVTVKDAMDESSEYSKESEGNAAEYLKNIVVENREERENHHQALDSEQEMNKSSHKAEVEFEAEESENCSQGHGDPEPDMKASNDEEEGIGFKELQIEVMESGDTEEGSGFEEKAEMREEVNGRAEHPSGETMVTPFNLITKDEIGFGTEMKVSSDDEEGIGFKEFQIEVMEEGSEFEEKAKMEEEMNGRAEDPSGETMTPFNLNTKDEIVFGTEMKVSSDDEEGIGFKEFQIEVMESSDTEEGSGFEEKAEMEEEMNGKAEDPSGETMGIPFNLNDKDEIGFGTEAELGEGRSDKTEHLFDEGNVKDAIDGSSECNRGSEGNAAEYLKNIVIENRGSEDVCLNSALMKLNLQQATEDAASGNAGEMQLLIENSNILVELELGDRGKGEAPVVLPKLTYENPVSNTSSKPVFSDNKENIVGGKLVPVKQKVKQDGTAVGKNKKNKSLDKLSVRTLSKMLKEKLEITHKEK